MTTLRWRIIALLAWMTFLLTVDRFNLVGSQAVQLAPAVYIGALVAALLPLTPLVAPRSFPLLAVAISVLYAVLLGLNIDVAFASANMYATIGGYFCVLATLTLSYQVAVSCWEFRRAVESVTFANSGTPLGDINEMRRVIDVEMIRSRRNERPLSLMVFETDAASINIRAHKVVQSVQRSMLKRYVLTTVARVLSRTLRRTDVVFEDADPGRLMVVAPDTSEQEAERMARRITSIVQDRLGVEGKYSIAAFPQQALTFDDLLNVAEQRLHEITHEADGAQEPLALELGGRHPAEALATDAKTRRGSGD